MTNESNIPAREFFVNGRFETMSRRPGGLPRDAALQRAQAALDDLKAGFNEWLEQELLELKLAFEGIDQGGAAAFDSTYYRCAQLRDLGTPMGYALVTFVAKNLCDVLDTMKTAGLYDKSIIDCHIDALFLARRESFRGLHPDQVPEMTTGLQKIVAVAGTKSTT